MSERTTVRLPEALVVQAKRKAFAEGRTLTALIEDGLRRVISDDRAPSSAPRRLRLPVSKARGGLMPGIDPIRLLSDADELDDRRYIDSEDRRT